MSSVTLIIALIMSVLLTTTGSAHAAENRYGMATAPPDNATMVALTAYSDDESYVVTITRMGRVVVSETGTTRVAYDMGAFHALDGPENVLVESDIADLVVTARGVLWMEFPAHVDTAPPLAMPVARWTESGGGLLRDSGGGIRRGEGGRDDGCVRHAASGDRSPGVVVCAGLCRVAGRSIFLLPGVWGGLPPCAPWADAALLQGPTREARAAPTSGGRCDVLREYRGCAPTCTRALRRGNDHAGN